MARIEIPQEDGSTEKIFIQPGKEELIRLGVNAYLSNIKDRYNARALTITNQNQPEDAVCFRIGPDDVITYKIEGSVSKAEVKIYYNDQGASVFEPKK